MSFSSNKADEAPAADATEEVTTTTKVSIIVDGVQKTITIQELADMITTIQAG